MKVSDVYGSKIKNIRVDDGMIIIYFEDAPYLKMEDTQSCCESRYFHVDDADDLSYYDGAILMEIELGRHDELDAKYDTHEICFLDIKTSKGVLSICAHNEHNGYYGGFCIKAEINGRLGYEVL